MTTEDYDRQDTTEGYARFAISEEHALNINAALPMMIVNRMGYMDRQALEEEPTADADIRPYIDIIVERSSKEADYLLPDTPMKEAIFRLILANGNEPMSADEISETLSERWAMSAYPRSLSPHIINRLLENSGNYCITAIQERADE